MDGEPAGRGSAPETLVAPEMLFGKPRAGLMLVAVTGKLTVQLPEAGMLMPEKLSWPLCPALKLFPLAPVQLPVAAPALATCRLARVSLKATEVRIPALGLLRVTVTLELCPAPICSEPGENEVVIWGA